jgi:hypothetical protein
MIEVTERPLSKEEYLRALDLGLTLWPNYRTGEVFIQRRYWRNLTPAQKANAIRHLEGMNTSNHNSE